MILPALSAALYGPVRSFKAEAVLGGRLLAREPYRAHSQTPVTCTACRELVEPLVDEGTPFVRYDADGNADAIVEGTITFVCPRCGAEISERASDMSSRVASQQPGAGPKGESEASI